MSPLTLTANWVPISFYSGCVPKLFRACKTRSDPRLKEIGMVSPDLTPPIFLDRTIARSRRLLERQAFHDLLKWLKPALIIASYK
jgi:hypothetical protein